MHASTDNSIAPRWLSWCAMLTLAAVCPVLFLGALVTSMKVGMADHRSFVWPHIVIMELFNSERDLGWKIEHSHRLSAWLAGLCGILLAIACRLGDTRRGYRWLGAGVVGLIGSQAILGAFRVQLNALWGPGLAWIHGCFAQLVFAAMACLALMMTRTWARQPALPESAAPLRRWSLVCLGLLYGQLVLGGLIRHHPSLLTARIHMLTAFLVLAALLWLAKLAFAERTMAIWLPTAMLLLLGLEIVLGVEAAVNWMWRFFSAFGNQETIAQMLPRTAHYFVGSLLFASVASIALICQRRVVAVDEPAEKHLPAAPAGVHSLQGGMA